MSRLSQAIIIPSIYVELVYDKKMHSHEREPKGLASLFLALRLIAEFFSIKRVQGCFSFCFLLPRRVQLNARIGLSQQMADLCGKYPYGLH